MYFYILSISIILFSLLILCLEPSFTGCMFYANFCNFLFKILK